MLIRDLKEKIIDRTFKPSSKIFVVYDGVSLNKIKDAKPFALEGDHKILVIIASMKYLPENYYLYIIGHGPQKPCLEGLVQSLSLRKHVHFLSFQQKSFIDGIVLSSTIKCGATKHMGGAGDSSQNTGSINFKRTIRLKNGAPIFARPLAIKDIIPLHKMYLSLSGNSKLFFHPYFFQPKLGWLWIRDGMSLVLSCFSVFRKIFLKIFPKAVHLSLVGLNSNHEIVAFTFLRIMKRIGNGYAAEEGTVVRDDYQNKGLGSQLQVCRDNFGYRSFKVRELHAFVLTENLRKIHINQKLGWRIIKTIEKRDFWKNKFYQVHEMVLHLEKSNLSPNLQYQLPKT